MTAVIEYLTMIDELHKRHGATNGFARFLLDHGREFTVDERTFAGKRAKAKECYANAGRVALWHDDLFYVEGYVAAHGLPISHAWLSTHDGVAVDPTLKHGAGADYFGVPFKSSYLQHTIARQGFWGLLGVPTPELADLYKRKTEPAQFLAEIVNRK